MSFTDIQIEGGSNDYVKLVSGTVVTLHILSHTPTKQVLHWVNKKKATCTGEKTCEYCQQGDKPKQRWTAEVWDRKEQKVKKLEFGTMIASQLKGIAEMLAESQQTIHDTDIRIKTVGSSLETEYTVLPVPMAGIIPQEITDQYPPF